MMKKYDQEIWINNMGYFEFFMIKDYDIPYEFRVP